MLSLLSLKLSAFFLLFNEKLTRWTALLSNSVLKPWLKTVKRVKKVKNVYLNPGLTKGKTRLNMHDYVISYIIIFALLETLLLMLKLCTYVTVRK